MLGRWPATNTCLFSGRTAYTVPSLALRRAGLPSCASQPKSDGHHVWWTATRAWNNNPKFFRVQTNHGLRLRLPKVITLSILKLLAGTCTMTCFAGKKLKTGREGKRMTKQVIETGRDSRCTISQRHGTANLNWVDFHDGKGRAYHGTAAACVLRLSLGMLY